jgi:hypothetical protein
MYIKNIYTPQPATLPNVTRADTASCSRAGAPAQACDSPLAVTLAAGSVALPPLLKLIGEELLGPWGELLSASKRIHSSFSESLCVTRWPGRSHPRRPTGVMEKGGQDLATCEQLPLEIELGQEFVYRSIFACPVSRDQSTPGACGVAALALGAVWPQH